MDVSVLQYLTSAAESEPPSTLPHFFGGVSGVPLLSKFTPSIETTDSLPAGTLRGCIAGIYGADEETVKGQLRRLHSACTRFIELYGDGPVRILRAPARINILGEHVDYVSYIPTVSLPFGSREYDMLMLYRPSAESLVRGASTLARYEPFSFSMSKGSSVCDGEQGRRDWGAYLQTELAPPPHWANYVKGAVYFALLKYGARVRRGIDFLVDSRIPPSGGASSSSALVVLSGAAIRAANSIRCAPNELALDSSEAEWYVGTRGGAMDHLTICLAKERHAVFISYRDLQARPVPLHRSDDHRWVTFFSHPADKGKEVMLEYNERAAVSRLIIPAITASWKEADADLYAAWVRAVEGVANATDERLEEIESLIQALPETLTVAEVGRLFPDTHRDLALSFPALVSERGEFPLRVRGLAAHHASEVRRVNAAQETFTRKAAGGRDNDGSEQEMRFLGALLNESHQSLRDNYRVSTDDVERLVALLRSQMGVFGVRLMGGGFGGNVLALTSKEDVDSIIGRVQSEYYEPQGRVGVREGSVMISTPGDGLSQVRLDTPWRKVIEEFNSLGRAALDYREKVNSLLDCLPAEITPGEVQPVIVAAGKGSRAHATGLEHPKPLAQVSDVPAIERVLRTVCASLPGGRPPIVIVSPGNEVAIRHALAEEEVLFVMQPEALGTGNAVLCAADHILAAARTLVIWGTQPVIRPETITRMLKLAALFDEFDMVLPTAMMESPYAPLSRDELGRVVQARETHLEKTATPPFGETNLGLFLLQSEALLHALVELHRRHWMESDHRYDRPAGELGFPNEMINFLSGREGGIFASPIADWREAQGIKSREDVACCERFISELQE